MLGLLITIAAIAIAIFLKMSMPKKKSVAMVAEETVEAVLQKEVAYYQKLEPAEKERFEKEVRDFLTDITITGANTTVSDRDRILVAASGIIPIFAFPGWKYPNLREVLLYPDNFDEHFSHAGNDTDRRILGMVGEGAMNYTMILSKPALQEGFKNKGDKENTAIHEFVHLMDKTDGSVDGVPELLLGKAYVKPWLHLIHKAITDIKNSKSDINPYGATNEAEFFAVASEYFFERPQLLEEKHPELYAMLEKIFKQDIAADLNS